jgi:hypothetical protein
MWVPNALYFRGVFIGLLIAWVTSALAYYRSGTKDSKASRRLLVTLIKFEFVVSVAMLIISLILPQ